jgi:transposase
MAETRRKFDHDFREGAVRLVRETGRPIAEVARDLGINAGTLGNWVNVDKRRRGDGTGALDEDERAELTRLRKENAELAMEGDVLTLGGAPWHQDRRPCQGGGLDREPQPPPQALRLPDDAARRLREGPWRPDHEPVSPAPKDAPVLGRNGRARPVP